MGQADVNAIDKVSHITLIYELFSFKHSFLLWCSKSIPTSHFTSKMPTILNILIILFDEECFKEWEYLST